MSNLPIDAKDRKAFPIFSGVMNYFPRALMGVAAVSVAGNQQHNPGEPLHWSRHKSTDHLDCISRHLIDFEDFDSDGMLHCDKIAWRALALAQMVHEARDRGLTYSQYIELLKSFELLKSEAAKP